MADVLAMMSLLIKRAMGPARAGGRVIVFVWCTALGFLWAFFVRALDLVFVSWRMVFDGMGYKGGAVCTIVGALLFAAINWESRESPSIEYTAGAFANAAAISVEIAVEVAAMATWLTLFIALCATGAITVVCGLQAVIEVMAPM